ncbi:MAG: intradiol ring-cleavage dioxygenase [Verrucomicrobiales bacterium]|nr:intradiol ring-cleavage dioxygenase [Verrucomicrobiales bacterium]
MKQIFCPDCHRRDFLRAATAGSAALFTSAGAFAEALSLTPFQTEGPFYPDKLPLDTDNDLIIMNDSVTPSVGEITHLHGRVLDKSGEPAAGAVVELWMADANGCYIHSQGAARGQERDGNFQGFGRFRTASDGRYYFRAIKPVPYGPRTAHYHVAVYRGGKRVLTTQCYIKGQELNKTDRILNSVTDKKLRDLLITEFKPVKGSKAGELEANWDIIVGLTPEDRGQDKGRKGPGTGFRPDGKGKGKGKGKGNR